jgi:F like protein
MAVTASTIANTLLMRNEVDRYLAVIENDLFRMWRVAWAEVVGEFAQAAQELIDIGDGDWPTRTQVLRAQRAQNALKAALEALQAIVPGSEAAMQSQLRQVLASAEHWTQQIARSQFPAGVSVGWARADAAAIQQIVVRTTSRIHALHRPLTAEMEANLKAVLIRGVMVGDNPQAAARQLLGRCQQVFNGSWARAANIARTEMLDSFRAAARQSRLANTDVIKGWKWHTTLSARTCPACLSQAGSEHPASEPGPLGHQQCVLPGAVVSGPRAEASTARWFDGEVIDLYTDGGRFLSVTPNHPVLTPQGWVAAGLLYEGGYIVGSPLAEGPAPSNIPDDHQVPAAIEKVAESLGGSLFVDAVAMPTAAEDFHGDGSGSNVHVVRADSSLREDLNSPRLEHASHCPFAGRDADLPSLSGLGGEDLALHGGRDASGSGMGGSRDSSVFLGSSSVSQGAVDFKASPDWDIGGSEPAFYRGAGNAVAFRQSVHRSARDIFTDDRLPRVGASGALLKAGLIANDGVPVGLAAPQSALNKGSAEPHGAYVVPTAANIAAFTGQVVTDRILKVVRRRWSGHVYNLQTAGGWYVANNIIVHNCRCTAVPITRSWKELGFNLPEPRDEFPNARQWFREQPRATRLRIMGKERLSRLESGELKWQDLSTRVENPHWRPSYVVAPLSGGRNG